MAVSGEQVADFFHELALLTRSGLPLPDSIRQLGAAAAQRQFRETLEQLGRDTAGGTMLSAAMQRHPDLFQPLHLKLIAAGEESGHLPEALAELAASARMQLQLVRRTREALLYPMCAMIFALGIFGLLMTMVIPKFAVIFDEMLSGEPLPLLTRACLRLSAAITACPWCALLLYLGLILFVLILYWNSARSTARFYRMLRWLPGAAGIARANDQARLCMLWSVFLRHELPLPTALEQIAPLLENGPLTRDLQRLAERVSRGQPLAGALTDVTAVDGLLRLTVSNAPEHALAAELAGLAELYAERARATTQVALGLWEGALIVTMSTMYGGIILAMFTPLIVLIRKLGG